MHRRYLTHDGLTLHLAAWARRLGCRPTVLSTRLARGYTVEATLTTPVARHSKIYEAIVAYEARHQEDRLC